MAPSEAAAMPFPNEETTPPVTNTKRVMGSTAGGLETAGLRDCSTGHDGPTVYQGGLPPATSNSTQEFTQQSRAQASATRRSALDEQAAASPAYRAVREPQQRMRVAAGRQH